MDEAIATEISKMDLKSEETPKNAIDIVKSGNMEDFEHLLKAELDLESKDDFGNTLLHLACTNGHLNIVNLLLDHGANIRSKNDIYNTPLHETAKAGNIDIIRVLLKKKAFINVRNGQDNTPIHLAALYGQLSVVQELVSKSADIQIMNIYGELPLHSAIQNGHEEVVNYLLELGGNTFGSNKNLLLHYAAKYNQNKIITLLCEKYSADVALKNGHGNIPLHLAAANGHLECIDGLLEKESDINCLNTAKQTPLHLAIINKHISAVEKLILCNADVSCGNNKPLILAAHSGNLDVFQLLMEFGINDGSDEALYSAAKHDFIDIVKYLSYKFGKSENYKSYLHIALYKAVEVESVRCAKILFNNGANKSYYSGRKSTIHLIMSSRNDEIRNILNW